MGFGDELMLTGTVKRAYEKRKKPVCLGRFGKNYLADDGECLWKEVFENNPKISEEIYPGCVWVPEIKGNRPYIDYIQTQALGKVVYKESYRPTPGEIFFTEQEKAQYAKYSGFIYIEPNVKFFQGQPTFGGNKDWGFERWQEVVNRSPYEFIQGKGRKLDGVTQVDTERFRDACALLSRSRLFVGPDGGMHHAAAALGLPAVVVWGGLVGPEVLGYDTHTNLRGKGVRSCGNHKPCEHCRDAMNKVTVDMVIDAIHKEMNQDIWLEAEGRN